jgi:hypothetical protein
MARDRGVTRQPTEAVGEGAKKDSRLKGGIGAKLNGYFHNMKQTIGHNQK